MTNRNLPEPLNTQERFLYEIAIRQGILIEQVGSIIDYIASKENVATTNNKVEEKIAVQKVVEDTETVVQPEPSPRKRAPRKKAVEKEVE